MLYVHYVCITDGYINRIGIILDRNASFIFAIFFIQKPENISCCVSCPVRIKHKYWFQVTNYQIL